GSAPPREFAPHTAHERRRRCRPFHDHLDALAQRRGWNRDDGRERGAVVTPTARSAVGKDRVWWQRRLQTDLVPPRRRHFGVGAFYRQNLDRASVGLLGVPDRRPSKLRACVAQRVAGVFVHARLPRFAREDRQNQRVHRFFGDVPHLWLHG